jgi:hypothetical protein
LEHKQAAVEVVVVWELVGVAAAMEQKLVQPFLFQAESHGVVLTDFENEICPLEMRSETFF